MCLSHKWCGQLQPTVMTSYRTPENSKLKMTVSEICTYSQDFICTIQPNPTYVYIKMYLPMYSYTITLQHTYIHTLVGVPNTAVILNSVSISLLPGKSGLKVYVSYMMHPTAHRSMGLL